jgi:MoaA/NifB/PqqE/SkfB family radical SAM enzyme
LSSVGRFVGFGLRDVTLSGGDPLTMSGLVGFLARLRSTGVRTIKLDTVGVGLITQPLRAGIALADLLAGVDYLGIPLDGWSDESAIEFRRGRSRIYTETIALLDAIDVSGGMAKVIINSVAHCGNVGDMERIYQELVRHACVCQWNVFQYTATDRAERGVNARLAISDDSFDRARERFFNGLVASRRTATPFVIDFRSTRSRLGQYLLVNSDGEAWLPDNDGRTVRLGTIFDREQDVLDAWSETVDALAAPVPEEPARVVLSANG